jgi:Uma2 family endonuclease
MGEVAHNPYYSIAEYLEIEKNSLEKYEYHVGEVFAMVGGTLNHGLLSANVCGSLRDAIKKKGKSCRTYSSDARIAISDERYVYADAFVVCGPTETYEEMPQAAKNPILIVEVLSDSTALYDREGKFQLYQQIVSLQEYVLISQDKVLVEVFYKSADVDFWQYRAYRNLTDSINLKSLDVEITLADVYLDSGVEK